MKAIKSLLVVVYYLVVQTIVCIGLIIWKIVTDPDWVDRLLDSSGFYDNVALTSELVLPAIIIADLVILIPLLFKSKFSAFKKVGFIDAMDCVMLGLFCNLVISYVVTKLETLPIADSYNELMDLSLSGNAFFTILSAGILAPLVEELCFRYWMFDIAKEKSEKYKIIVSALMFGLAHFNVIQSTYAFIMGLVLGTVYSKTKNLWCSILIHFAMNMSSVLLEVLPLGGQYFVDILFLVSIIYIPWTILKKKNILVRQEFC